MLLPTRKVNARIRKKKPNFSDKYLGESSLRCCSVLHLVCQGWRTSASSTISPHSSSSRAPALRLSHFTQFIFLLTTFFLCCPWYSLCARDSRYFKIITSPHSKRAEKTLTLSWEHIGWYWPALISSGRSQHISILSWALSPTTTNDFGVCKLFSYIFRALI